MLRIRISGSRSGRIFEFWPDQDQEQDRKLGGRIRIRIRIIQVLSQIMRIQYLSFFMQKSQDQVQDRTFSDFQDSGSGSGSHFFWQDQDQDQKIPDPIITTIGRRSAGSHKGNGAQRLLKYLQVALKTNG